MLSIKRIGSDNQNWNIRQVVTMMENGTMVFDSLIQRTAAWNLDQRSLLIHSAIYGYDIGNMCLVRTKMKHINGKSYYKYSGYDGKQRNTTFYMYVKDQFALTESTPPIIILDENCNEYEYEIAGKKFSELDSAIQDEILSRNLSFRYFEDLTIDEERELFYRKNNGTPLTSIEMVRAKAESLDAFIEISKHPAIQLIVAKNGRLKYCGEKLSMLAWIILYVPNPSFATRDFDKYIENAVVTTSQMEHIKSCFDMIDDLLDEFRPESDGRLRDGKLFRKLTSRLNFVSLVYLAHECIKSNVDTLDYIKKVKSFFSTEGQISISQEYNAAVGRGSSSVAMTKARKAEMLKLLGSPTPKRDDVTSLACAFNKGAGTQAPRTTSKTDNDKEMEFSSEVLGVGGLLSSTRCNSQIQSRGPPL